MAAATEEDEVVRFEDDEVDDEDAGSFIGTGVGLEVPVELGAVEDDGEGTIIGTGVGVGREVPEDEIEEEEEEEEEDTAEASNCDVGTAVAEDDDVVVDVEVVDEEEEAEIEDDDDTAIGEATTAPPSAFVPLLKTKVFIISGTVAVVTYFANASVPHTLIILDVPPGIGVISWKLLGLYQSVSLLGVASGRVRGTFMRSYNYQFSFCGDGKNLKCRHSPNQI